jgi:hypothetical protein
MMRAIVPAALLTLLTVGCDSIATEIIQGFGRSAPADPGAGSAAGGENRDCDVSPPSFVQYQSEEELQRLLVGRWQRCVAPQVAGEDVGVEFTADHRWYPLTRVDGAVVRRTGVDYGGEWRYLPPGEPNLISHQPDPRGQFVITAITDPPRFTDNPRQLRVTFSPVLSIYIPLR